MKLLLTSAGITNEIIANALDSLTDVSRTKLKIAFVPTAANMEPGKKDWFFQQIKDLEKFKYTWVDVVDFSASNIDWRNRLSECDVIFISGGNTFHLLHQTKLHGFDKWINENLNSKVFVGASAGSILFTPTIKICNVEPADTNYSNISDMSGLDLVDFEVSPHTPEMLTYESNESYSKTSQYKLYAIDDNTAIKVVEKNHEVVTNGKWKLFD